MFSNQRSKYLHLTNSFSNEKNLTDHPSPCCCADCHLYADAGCSLWICRFTRVDRGAHPPLGHPEHQNGTAGNERNAGLETVYLPGRSKMDFHRFVFLYDGGAISHLLVALPLERLPWYDRQRRNRRKPLQPHGTHLH